MRFKRIALLFILIANTLLLAHSFIPHHHHNGQVCTGTSQAHNEKSGSTDSDSYPDDDDDDTRCILGQTVVIPPNISRAVEIQQLKINNLENFNLNQSVILFSSDDFPDFCTLFDYHHYSEISFLYSFQVNNSRGLRAPPLS